MSMSAARARMTMTAHVLRNQAEHIVDGWNAPADPVWEPRSGASGTIPCHCWSSRDVRRAADGVKVAVVEEFRMMTPHDADLSAADRIDRITDRRGNVLFPGPLVVDGPERMETHTEWRLGRGRAD